MQPYTPLNVHAAAPLTCLPATLSRLPPYLGFLFKVTPRTRDILDSTCGLGMALPDSYSWMIWGFSFTICGSRAAAQRERGRACVGMQRRGPHPNACLEPGARVAAAEVHRRHGCSQPAAAPQPGGTATCSGDGAWVPRTCASCACVSFLARRACMICFFSSEDTFSSAGRQEQHASKAHVTHCSWVTGKAALRPAAGCPRLQRARRRRNACQHAAGAHGESPQFRRPAWQHSCRWWWWRQKPLQVRAAMARASGPGVPACSSRPGGALHCAAGRRRWLGAKARIGSP